MRLIADDLNTAALARAAKGQPPDHHIQPRDEFSAVDVVVGMLYAEGLCLLEPDGGFSPIEFPYAADSSPRVLDYTIIERRLGEYVDHSRVGPGVSAATSHKPTRTVLQFLAKGSVEMKTAGSRRRQRRCWDN